MTDSDESLEREIGQTEKLISLTTYNIELYKRELEGAYSLLSLYNTQLARLKSMRRKATP